MRIDPKGTVAGRPALLVFDFALIQLGGLSFGSAGNKIADARAAGVLMAFVAEWYRSIAGHVVPPTDTVT